MASPAGVRIASAAVPAWQEEALEVSVNALADAPTLVVLRDAHGEFWLEAGDFHALRLKRPPATPQVFHAARYYPLASVSGLRIELDEQQQRLSLTVPPEAFEATVRSQSGPPTGTWTPASPGAYFDYQLSAQHVPDGSTGAALLKLGVFGPIGVLDSSAVMRADGDSLRTVRLDTTWVLDLPGSLKTLWLGDGISTPGNWGYAMRFGGLHWGSNFSLRPDLITMPMLAVSGSAVVPSTVDVLVNGQSVASQSVPPGPFIIRNLPPLSGSGQVNVVVRDALGNQQLISQPFYAAPALLAAGLQQYSIDVGALRENYALNSSDYGPWVGQATWRRGLTDALTLEGRAEADGTGVHAEGLDAALRLGSLAVVSLTGVQGGDTGAGWLWGVSVQRQAALFSITASLMQADPGFRQVGDDVSSFEQFRRKLLLQTGLYLGSAGSLSLAYVQQTYPDQPRVRNFSAGYTHGLGRRGSFGLTLSRIRGADSSTSGYLYFVYALGARDSAGMSAQGGSGGTRNELQMTYAHSPPIGTGAGYRLSVGTGGDYDADYRQQFSGADVEFQAARNDGLAGQSLTADGTLAFMDGGLYAMRAMSRSFAVVDLGLPDTPVYLENQLVAHTDAQGRALLPDLVPYVENRVSINPEQLPVDVSIGARVVSVIPPAGAGVTVRFPVQRSHAVTFHLLLRAGSAVPAGATLEIEGHGFKLGLEGLAFVTGVDHLMQGLARWDGGECRFTLVPPHRGEDIPDLGPVLCRPFTLARH